MPQRSSSSQGADAEGIENFQLPKALVTRIAKSALSHDAKLQKDTVSALVDGSTIFINYLAATAQDVASSRSHKTIAAPDVLKALEIIEFGDFVPLLQSELDIYRGTGRTIKGKGKAVDVKGKEKESSTISDARIPQANSPSAADPEGPEFEGGREPQENADEDNEDVFDEDGEGAEADDEDPDDNDGEEPEDIVDTVAIETEELIKDQRGLDEDASGNNKQ